MRATTLAAAALAPLLIVACTSRSIQVDAHASAADAPQPDASPPLADGLGSAESILPSDTSTTPTKGPVTIDGAVVMNVPNCVDVSNEPNNSISKATKMDAAGQGNIPGWEICYPGDLDIYAWTCPAGGKLSVKVTFVHLTGDLDAALLLQDGTVIDASRSVGNGVEEVGISNCPTKQKVYVAVWGFNGATNKYDLHVKN